MSPQWMGLLATVFLLALILLRVPVAIALILIGFAGNGLLQGIAPAVTQLQLVTWEVAGNFAMLTIPMFIWMGQLAHATGLGRDVFYSFSTWIGRAPGGLAVTSIVSSASFGAVTGSSIATVMAMGNVLMPEMKRYRYDTALAAGSLASGGVLAILIPPSIPLVFYGAWTETSIGDLFVAGIIPGLLLTFLFSAYVLIHCKLNPALGPKTERYSWRQKWASLRYLLPATSVLVFVLGSIYAGIATPTEAAAAGVLGVMIIGLLTHRLTVKKFIESIEQSASASCNIFLLLLGGVFFSRFIAQTGITESMIAAIAQLDVSPYLIIAVLVLMYLVLGAVLDTFGMILLTLPFVFPLILSLGYDPVWFGIFIVMMIELSLITPPIGINVFVMHRIIPETSIGTIFKGTFPFVLLTLLAIVLLVLFPEMALWLPAAMKS